MRREKKKQGKEIEQKNKEETEDEGERKEMGARTRGADRKRGY